jgi:hypothetical protein
MIDEEGDYEELIRDEKSGLGIKNIMLTDIVDYMSGFWEDKKLILGDDEIELTDDIIDEFNDNFKSLMKTFVKKNYVTCDIEFDLISFVYSEEHDMMLPSNIYTTLLKHAIILPIEYIKENIFDYVKSDEQKKDVLADINDKYIRMWMPSKEDALKMSGYELPLINSIVFFDYGEPYMDIGYAKPEENK